MPGVGKSTIGRLLAGKIGFAFLDLDNLIRDSEGKTHAQIASERGDRELSRLEESYTLKANLEKTVFAPGGSIVYSELAMEKLCRETQVIYLAADLAVISQRLGDQIAERGIVGFAEKGLAGVFAERASLYEKYAHRKVECGAETAEQLAEQLAHLSIS
ncbi:MAG: shikimate kinase [Parcubacteria group bacterium Gr01-1014_19]|nr:MAG: shikimate kinase [Parcubacteria group bacterium Gr01-1014_19]